MSVEKVRYVDIHILPYSGHTTSDKNLSDTKTFLGGFTMPLVSMKEMLNKALEGKYAVGQFNMNNLEWTQAILAAAEEEKSPVILGVSEGAARHMTGFKTVVAMVKALIEEMNITVPVAIHLDHGSSLKNVKKQSMQVSHL